MANRAPCEKAWLGRGRCLGVAGCRAAFSTQIRQAEISKGMSTKAGAALRRSGVRIRSLGTGHTSLNLVISELSSVRQTLKDSIAAQQRGQGLFV